MMPCWIIGTAAGESDNKIKMANFLLKNQYSIVPPFHYSIFGANPEVLKNLYIIR